MKQFYYNNKNVFISFGIVFLVFILLFMFLQDFKPAHEHKVSQMKLLTQEEFEADAWRTPVEFDQINKLDVGSNRNGFAILMDLSDYPSYSEHSILEFNSPVFRKAHLYRITEDGEKRLIAHAGNLTRDSNPFKHPNPIYEILTEEGDSPYLVAEFQSEVPVNFTVTISPKFSFFKDYSHRLLIVSIYMGLMLALFMYNLILYFSVKDRVYLYYCLYILFIGLAQLSIMGYTYYFFLGENAYLYEVSIIGFTVVASLFGIPFVRMFLKTKEYVPVLDKVLLFLMGSYALTLILRLAGLIEMSYFLTDLNGLAVVIVFLTIGIILVKKGFRPAVYFLIAWGLFLVGLVIFILQNFGVLNLDGYANFPMLAGTACEAILLSLALADRINILKKEKEQEQYEKLAALKENERLVKQQNSMLEEKVLNRTEELEKTLKNLQDTQTQLVNQEKMASLGQLTAGVAHEINNPINFVSSNVNPLKRDVADLIEIMEAYREKGAKEFSETSLKELKRLEDEIELDYVKDEINQLLQGMEDGAKRTVEIVKGLKLFSRVDEQDVKKVDIHAGISSTLVLLNSSMSNKIQIVKDFGQIPMVECLAGKINQVFMNIVNNAVHALTEHLDKNPNPEIIIRTSMDGDDFVKIEIIDNGPGIPDEVKARIFEPFFTTKPVGKGTGLGLSIVFTIIEKHSGTLEVESCPDAGTAFIIRLPVHQESDMI
ncbi:phosphate starvation-inducible protein PsiE [Litoribacter alkaliphilus]|uniref:histidine kinase n=1 Tax=Litoribacter ruber TaxID=702568 RepID=A0AAP2CFC5_9BACT|nr:7TM diverse intracellular signaling domain-containing protein [Litoribacter alkaliphilus]MBS9522887.1 phosphate starvation-inducible protein PsiE [Litoribacter alkaliphilus]